MRVLKSVEMKSVAGGTFCLLGGLFRGWGRSSCAPSYSSGCGSSYGYGSGGGYSYGGGCGYGRRRGC